MEGGLGVFLWGCMVLGSWRGGKEFSSCVVETGDRIDGGGMYFVVGEIGVSL